MKAMVLLSGGIDSTTCLGIAVDKYGKENVIALGLEFSVDPFIPSELNPSAPTNKKSFCKSV